MKKYDWSTFQEIEYDHHCTKCGKHATGGNLYIPQDNAENCMICIRLIIDEALCFQCAFFREKYILKHHLPMDYVIYPSITTHIPVISGHLYWVNDCVQVDNVIHMPRSQAIMSTFIHYNDGRCFLAGPKVGHNGVIPLAWKDEFPDEAYFVYNHMALAAVV